MLIDTHCHLDATEFGVDRQAVIERARRAGVGCIVMPAVDRKGFDAVQTLAATHGGLRYALGIHPLFVGFATDSDLNALGERARAAMGDPHFVGIGEIGLDYFVPDLDRARMQRFFEAQVRLARDLSLPVILHVRRAQDDILKQLRRFRPPGGIAHAFNGSVQQAEAFVSLGFALGLGGAMTYRRALNIRRLATALPLEHWVLETDAPDIPPEWAARQRNEPANLSRIAAVLADLRALEPARVWAATTANAIRVLPRLAKAPTDTSGRRD